MWQRWLVDSMHIQNKYKLTINIMGMEFGMSRELRISWKGAKSNKFNQTLLLFLKIGSLRYYLNNSF